MKSANLTIAISDHLTSFLIVPKNNQNHMPKRQNLYTRKTKNFDRVNFILDYLQIDWDKFSNSTRTMLTFPLKYSERKLTNY